MRWTILERAKASESGGTGATSPGRVVVLDYASGQWSVWNMFGSGTAIQTLWMQGTSIYGMLASGQVISESNGFLDLGGNKRLLLTRGGRGRARDMIHAANLIGMRREDRLIARFRRRVN